VRELKVCIADDEAEVRRSIIQKIRSVEPEAEIYDVGFGRSALRGICDVDPDLAFLDIRMPEMDGLELLAEVRRNSLRARLVMLSGYHEFEYARRALQLGAMDYLLKPADREQLGRIMREVKSDMDRRLLSDLKAAVREWDGSPIRILDAQAYRAGVWFDPGTFKKVRFAPRGTEDALMEQIRERAVCAFYPNEHTFAAIYQEDVPVPGAFTDKEAFPRVFLKEWERWEASRFFADSPRRHLLPQSDLAKRLHESASRVLSHARAGRLGELEDGLDEWRTYAEQLELPALRKEAAHLMALLDEGLANAHDVVVLEDDKIRYWSRWLLSSPTWDQMAERIRELVLASVQALRSLEEETNVVEQTAAVIRQTPYSQLNLESVAASVGVHPVTLSRLFKKETGMNFVQHLTRYRLEQARSLLISSKKTVKEIAEEVGYSDYRYFCTLFKKEFGTLPRTYRNR